MATAKLWTLLAVYLLGWIAAVVGMQTVAGPRASSLKLLSVCFVTALTVFPGIYLSAPVFQYFSEPGSLDAQAGVAYLLVGLLATALVSMLATWFLMNRKP